MRSSPFVVVYPPDFTVKNDSLALGTGDGEGEGVLIGGMRKGCDDDSSTGNYNGVLWMYDCMGTDPLGENLTQHSSELFKAQRENQACIRRTSSVRRWLCSHRS